MPRKRPSRPQRHSTGGCEPPIVGDSGPGTHVIRPAEDPAEAVERIVSRRHLLIEKGDVFLRRAPAALRGSDERDIYHLTRHEMEPLPGRFTNFEHAVAAGDEFATRQRVRLYFQEAPDHPPQLLKDCRG